MSMKDLEAAATWAMFKLNWQIIAGCVIVFGMGFALTDFQVYYRSYLIVFTAAAIYGLVGYYNFKSPQRRNPRIFLPLTATAQITFVIVALMSCSYIAASANLPLRDEALLAYDRSLGFDFRRYLYFVNDRPWLVSVLGRGYGSINWQLPIIVIVLPLAGFGRRVAEFIFAFTLALLATIIISTAVPAIGVYGVLGLTGLDFPNIVEGGGPNHYPGGYADTLRVAPMLRDGTHRMLDFFDMTGVLTFPSFHAISAVLYTWTFWCIRWLRPFSLLVNGLMLLATPIGGGHFVVDVLAGVLIATASISAARCTSRVLASTGQLPRMVTGPPEVGCGREPVAFE